MSAETQPTQVADKLVVTIDYTLTVEGEEVDSSREEGPLTYLHGYGNIISGLEKALVGLKVGDQKQVTVTPEDGYGEYDEEAVMEVPRDQFPAEIPLEPGIELHITDEDNETMHAIILEVGDDIVVLDTNHPLADQELNFDVTIVSLRTATKEELAHGHVHGEGGHHH